MKNVGFYLKLTRRVLKSTEFTNFTRFSCWRRCNGEPLRRQRRRTTLIMRGYDKRKLTGNSGNKA